MCVPLAARAHTFVEVRGYIYMCKMYDKKSDRRPKLHRLTSPSSRAEVVVGRRANPAPFPRDAMR